MAPTVGGKVTALPQSGPSSVIWWPLVGMQPRQAPKHVPRQNPEDFARLFDGNRDEMISISSVTHWLQSIQGSIEGSRLVLTAQRSRAVGIFASTFRALWYLFPSPAASQGTSPASLQLPGGVRIGVNPLKSLSLQ